MFVLAMTREYPKCLDLEERICKSSDSSFILYMRSSVRKQDLEAASHKASAVKPPTTHHENYQN